MVDVEHDHLGRSARSTPRLDGACARIRTAHEGHRTGGSAARAEQLFGGANPRKVDTRSRAAFEDEAFLAVPVQDRVHRVVDGQNEAVVHTQSPGALSVASRRFLKANARKDPETQEK